MFLVVGILLAALVGGIVLVGMGLGTDTSNEKPMYLIPGWILLIGTLTCMLVLSILWPVQYFTSLQAVNDMQAFHDSRATITGAIEKAQAVEIKGAGSVDTLVDLTYQQQSRSYTDLVADCRDRVAHYNVTYRETKALKEVPFFGRMRVSVPDSLQPITGDFCMGG